MAVPSMPAGVAGLRILGFCDWYTPEASGGAERAAHEIYRRLGAAGAQIVVVSAAHGTPHGDPGVSVDVVRSVDLSSIAGGYIAPAPGAFVAARRLVRQFRPHVVHVNTIHYTGSIAGAAIARRHHLPLVATVQLGSLEHLDRRTRRIAGAYERVVGGYILRRADRVLAVSRAAREHAIVLGARGHVATLAPNGADHDRFCVPPPPDSDRPLVVSVGRLTANKGPDVLVEAAAALAAAGVRFRVAFVGDGPMRAGLEARVRELGLSGVVEFAGHVGDPERWVAQAAIVVRASYTEGLALAVVESLAAGRCTIVSDIAANRELVEHGRNGLTFRCGDSDDLARTLRTALADQQLRERLGRAGRDDVEDLTWDNSAALHGEALVAVAAGH
jgi:glycosyltransferase involved in cell wall biosynthesis